MDDRQFWNPGGLFVESATKYLRDPNKSHLWAACSVAALLVVAVVVVGVVVVLVIQAAPG